MTRACRTLKCTRVLLAMGARNGSRLPNTEMHTSVNGHGCKKWHAPAAHWNVHECYWPWVQELTRACSALNWTHGRLSTFGSKLAGGRSTHHICQKVTKSAKNIWDSLCCNRSKENLADFLRDYLSENRSRVTGVTADRIHRWQESQVTGVTGDMTVGEMIFWPLMFKLILIIIIVMLGRFIRRCIGYISRPSSQYRERYWWWVQAL